MFFSKNSMPSASASASGGAAGAGLGGPAHRKSARAICPQTPFARRCERPLLGGWSRVSIEITGITSLDDEGPCGRIEVPPPIVSDAGRFEQVALTPRVAGGPLLGSERFEDG